MAQQKPSRPEREENTTSRPLFKTKCGRVQIACWEQPTSQGSLFTVVTFKRSYKVNGEFKDAFNFSLADLDDIRRGLEDVKQWAKENRREG